MYRGWEHDHDLGLLLMTEEVQFSFSAEHCLLGLQTLKPVLDTGLETKISLCYGRGQAG